MKTQGRSFSRRALLKTIGVGGSAWALAQVSSANGDDVKEVQWPRQTRRTRVLVVLKGLRDRIFSSNALIFSDLSTGHDFHVADQRGWWNGDYPTVMAKSRREL